MSMLKEVVQGQEAPKTVRLQGNIQGRVVLMLVYLGSSHSFISQTLADKLDGKQKALQPVRVCIADGGTLTYVGEFARCAWSIQGVTFRTDLQLLRYYSGNRLVGAS